MRHFLFILILLSFAAGNAVIAQSQPFEVSYSAPFEVPKGFTGAQSIQCRNGSTFLLQFSDRTSTISLYNSDHQLVKASDINGIQLVQNCGTGPFVLVCGSSPLLRVCEIGDELILFMLADDKGHTTINRIAFSTTNGSETSRAEMNIPQSGEHFDKWKTTPTLDYYPNAAQRIPYIKYYVVKDPASDCYAIALFDNAAAAPNHRITVQHYNGRHTLLDTYFIDAPGNEKLFNRYLDLAVRDSSAVYLLTHVYLPKQKKIKFGTIASILAADNAIDNEYNLNIFKPGDAPAQTVLVGKMEQVAGSSAVIKTGPAKGTIYVLISNRLGNYGINSDPFGGRAFKSFSMQLFAVNPITMAVTGGALGGADLLQAAYQKAHKKDKEFEPLAADIQINKDNHDVYVLLEDFIAIKEGLYQPGYGDAAVLTMDESLQPRQGDVLPKAQIITEMSDLFMHEQQNKPADQGAYSSVTSYRHITTAGGRYILFNDDKDNLEEDAGSSPDPMVFYCFMRPVVFKLQGDKMERHRLYMPADKEHTDPLCLISSGYYSEEKNTLTALSLDAPIKHKKDKGFYLWEMRGRLTWVHFKE